MKFPILRSQEKHKKQSPGQLLNAFICCLIVHGPAALATPPVPGGFDHQHTLWTEVLRRHVKVNQAASRFDYRGLKVDPTKFDRYLGQLSAVEAATFKGWSKAEQMAFLINAYNAFTVKLILDNYPVKSIKKIGGLFGNPWKIKFISLLDEKVTLDTIEHEWLRPRYQEPRVHFAVNCASIGCPMLRNEAYVANQLDRQLSEQARLFLRDTSRNRLLADRKVLEVSKIFDWFKDDFKPSVSAYVAPFMSDDPKLVEQAKTFRVKFTDYDWNLNELKP